MNELQAQLSELEAKKAALFEDGSYDQVAISRLNAEIKEVQSQIAEIERQAVKEAERKEQIEEKVQAIDIPFAVSGVDFTALPVELITVIELVVKADRRRIYAEHALELEEAEAQYDNVSAQLAELEVAKALVEKEVEELKDSNVTLWNENTALKADKAQIAAERDEARQNRDNAAAQLEEAQREIKRLNSQIDDYQKAKVFGEREAQKVIEADATEAEQINNALQKLYTKFENFGSINKVYKPDGTFELATTADLQEKWTPAPPSVGGSESSESFRNEDPAIIVGDSGVQTPEVSAPVIDSPSVPLGLDVAQTNADGEVAPVTRAEFEELKQRVAAIEEGKVGAAA